VPPVQTSFDFDPKSANAASNATPITRDFGNTDSPAGLQGASCTLNVTDFPVDPPVAQSIGCTANTPTSGTPQAGTTSCSVGSGGGPPVATPLKVRCSGDPEASIQFSNKTPLIWGPIPSATRYKVYRGSVANLSSTYGAYRNSRDPNLTDMQFVELRKGSAIAAVERRGPSARHAPEAPTKRRSLSLLTQQLGPLRRWRRFESTKRGPPPRLRRLEGESNQPREFGQVLRLGPRGGNQDTKGIQARTQTGGL
jgi:hypothetical protein